MKRKILILFAICLLCALAGGCGGEKSISKVELPAVVPESPAQESVAPESTAQDLPEQNNSAPSQADVELDMPDAPVGKTTLVLGGIGLRDDTLASLVNNFNAENTKYTVVIDDYAENTQSREQAETVMQTKLFAGDAADIYYFRNDMLSPLPWISAGLLYDLDPLIASDSEISEEDIIPWTAMHEYGGLYLLSPTFGVVALSCSQQTQKLHTGWTITEYLDIEKSLRPEQDIIYCFTHSRFLRDCAELESCCRLMRQFLADAVQIFFGICELLCIAVDKADTSHNLRVSRYLRHLHPPAHTAPALQHLPDARRW